MPFEATFLLGLLVFFAWQKTGMLRHSLPGVRPAAWPGPKQRFSSCFSNACSVHGILTCGSPPGIAAARPASSA